MYQGLKHELEVDLKWAVAEEGRVRLEGVERGVATRVWGRVGGMRGLESVTLRWSH